MINYISRKFFAALLTLFLFSFYSQKMYLSSEISWGNPRLILTSTGIPPRKQSVRLLDILCTCLNALLMNDFVLPFRFVIITISWYCTRLKHWKALKNKSINYSMIVTLHVGCENWKCHFGCKMEEMLFWSWFTNFLTG